MSIDAFKSKERNDHKQLASEILDMTYGDLMALGYALSDILAGGFEDTSGSSIAQGLHRWAKLENEKSN